MRVEHIAKLYESLNSSVTGTRNEWQEGRCPFVWKHGGIDNHPSFGIKANQKGKSICKCWSCGYGGDLQDLVMDLKIGIKKNPSYVDGYDFRAALQLIAHELDDVEFDPSAIPEYGIHAESTIIYFDEDWLATFKSALSFKHARDYLHGRGVSDKMIEYLDVRYDSSQQRVCFPYRDAKGRLLGVQGRSIDPNNTLRYFQYGFKGKRNGIVWMNEDKVDFDRPVVLVEGPLDLTSVLRVYPNVLASFTSGLSVGKIKRVSNAVEVVSLYDYGNGGEAARAALDKILGRVPRTHLIPTEIQDDAGNMSISEVSALLEQAVKLKYFE